MPIPSYCAAGHRVLHGSSKPAKCPVCQGSMEPKSVSSPPTSTVASVRSPLEPSVSRYAWENDFQNRGIETERGGFDIKVHRDPGDGKILTIGALREAGSGPIERSESRSAPRGVESVSAAALVSEMLKGSEPGGQS